MVAQQNRVVQALVVVSPFDTQFIVSDASGVLDSALRVKGVDGLRVCDAAAMPTQITGNLNATVIAMAEKAADMMLDRTPLPPEDPRINLSQEAENAE